MSDLAYCLFGQDNDELFYEDAQSGIFCPSCGSVCDEDYVPQRIDVPLKYGDISFTSDGRPIVSQAFKDACEEAMLSGLKFVPIGGPRSLYFLFPERQLEFDAKRRRTRFEGLCPTCGQYESVIGATPAFLKGDSCPSEGIFRTDLSFGSGREKFPLLIVGVKTKAFFQKKGLLGLEFQPVRTGIPRAQ